MKNKKIWSVVLAAILALIAAGLIFKFTHKPIENGEPEQVKEEVIIEEDSIPAAETEQSQAPQETTAPAPAKSSVKKIETKAPKTVKKAVNKAPAAVSEKSSVKPETPVSVEIRQDVPAVVDTPLEKEVIVPVKYPQNTKYKYVYTPARFKKTK